MNFKRSLTGILIFSIAATAISKEKKSIIMTVDGEDIPTEEFLYLYQKNNEQQSQHQGLDEYLQLFEIFRIKVAEAKSRGVDTTENFKKEIDIYKKELLEPYITDSVFFNKLVQEALERENQRVESSHIMMIRTNNPERDKRNLEILDSLRTELLNGADFIELAKQYSQDKFSSSRGGYLGYAPAGTFPYSFETAVYETPEGEISEIVESHVGWHIVKSGMRKPAEEFNQPVKTYENVKADVNRKVTSPFDPRYHKIRENHIATLKTRHPSINIDGLSEDEAYTVLIEAEQEKQYADNPDYRHLVNEYIDGSLLYEVSVENVWNKAANDVDGLRAYYESNKDNYKWEQPRVKGFLVQATNDSIAELIKIEVADLPSDSIVAHIKKNFRDDSFIEKVNVAEGANAQIDYLMFGGEPAKPKFKNFATFFLLEGRLVESPEELEDVKAQVINDYQEVLEQEWINDLKTRHKVVLNEKEVGKLRKQMKQ